MIIDLRQKVQINFDNSKYLITTPQELGFTDPVEFKVLFKNVQSRDVIEHLQPPHPTVFNGSKVFSISLPKQS